MCSNLQFLRVLECRQNWKFDPLSSVITGVILPILTIIVVITVRNLKEWTQYWLDGLFYRVGPLIRRSVAARMSLKRYCVLSLRGQSRRLPVPSRTDVALDTDAVFVPLRLEGSSSSSTLYSPQGLADLGSRVRIVGDPGSGKSSLVKKIFRDACRRAVSGDNSAQLPILIELRDLIVPENLGNDGLNTWLYSHIRERLERFAVYRMSECFDTYSHTAGLLILLDGLDEVSTQTYSQVAKAISGLCHHLDTVGPNNRVVVTLRTHFHQQVRDALSSVFPDVVFVQPFTPTNIYEFLTRWPFKSGGNQQIVSIYTDLMDRPTLREMCTNPLVLAMYVADHQAAGGALTPDTRTEFYLSVCDELLIKRRLSQTGEIMGKTTLKEQRERILGAISLRHLLNEQEPANSIPWNHCVEAARSVTGLPFDRAEELLREIGKETGLISEERLGETVRFIHLTFCEFLAAKEAAHGERSAWSSLVNAHLRFVRQSESGLQARLLETLPFACGLLPRGERGRAIDDIIMLADARITVRAFLETKLYSHPGWSNFIREEFETLRQYPVTDWDEEWLHRVNLFNVVLRDAKFASAHMPVELPDNLIGQFVREIDEGSGLEALRRLFSALATHDATAALRLAESSGVDFMRMFTDVVIRSSDQAPFYALIAERAAESKSERGFWLQIFAESSLRSAVVRAFVTNTNPEDRWWSTEPPSRERWFTKSFHLKRPYTQLLDSALSARTERAPSFPAPLLDNLALSPAPSLFRWTGRVGRYLVLSPLCIIVIAWGLGLVHPVLIWVSPSLTGMGIAWFMLRYFAISAVYEQILYDDRSVMAQLRDRLQLPVDTQTDRILSPPSPLALLRHGTAIILEHALHEGLQSPLGRSLLDFLTPRALRQARARFEIARSVT